MIKLPKEGEKNMINIEKAKQEFKNFTKNYDITNDRIKVKIDHTYKVSKNSKEIAKSLNLSEEEIKLAELIGLLHDIGRFEQIKNYNTYLDKKSIDHATKALSILFTEGKIRNYIEENKYDNIIYKAIENHNKIKINDNLTKKEQLFCKIIRDADKLDIYRIVTTKKIENAVSIKTEDISKEILSDKIYNNFLKEEPILYQDIKTNIDNMVIWIAYIYDINFKETFNKIKQENYIEKIVKRVNFKDQKTKERMEEIKEKANKYINQKTK